MTANSAKAAGSGVGLAATVAESIAKAEKMMEVTFIVIEVIWWLFWIPFVGCE